MSWRLSFACLSLTAGLAAQADKNKPEQAIDNSSRVKRVLTTLQKSASFRCDIETVSTANQIMRQLRGDKSTTTRSVVVREGDLVCWTKNDGDQVLAQKGARWVTLDRDGNWIPARYPTGHAWKSAFLADPTFLADRLTHLLSATKWQAAGSKTIDDKAMLAYKAKLDLDEANHLVRSGALPAGGMGALGGIVMLAAGGAMGGAPPEQEREFEITIYEDPATHLPAQIIVKTFTDEAGGVFGAAGVVVRGGPPVRQADDEEEEEDGEAQDKKPSSTMTMTLSKIGLAKASDLTKAARRVLGMK